MVDINIWNAFQALDFNLTQSKNCDLDGFQFKEEKLREVGSVKNDSHSTSLWRICRYAGGRPNLDGSTNQNKATWLNEIAMLTIGNEYIVACQKWNRRYVWPFIVYLVILYWYLFSIFSMI
jgi:hypothetical protein